MKNKSIIVFLSFLFIFSSFVNAQWIPVKKTETQNTQISILSTKGTETIIHCQINAYRLHTHETPKGIQVSVEIPKGSFIQEKGSPNLQKLAIPLIIPNEDKMKVEIVSEKYVELKNIEVAPSKGVLYRTVLPQNVPYTYGKVYEEDAFYPTKTAVLNKPYIIRNYRGQTVWFYPLRYNPVTKVLRIYTDVTLKVYSSGEKDTENILSTNAHVTTSEFKHIYERRFLNYKTLKTNRYTPIEEGTPGRMLVIVDSALENSIMPFVIWKRQKGIETDVVTVQSIGNTDTDIKNYVRNYYDNHSDFTYLLLVGDGPQVTPSSTSAGVSDNAYGYLVGDDHRLDIFVGRFSAETEEQLKTQVEKTIFYERDIDTTATWLGRALGIASDEGGSGGDDGESDKEHMENIRTDLETYGYVVGKVYQGEEVDTDITNWVNDGTGLINYVGHGDVQLWHSVNPHDYTNAHVNALENAYQLPFIWSVACQVGNFKNNTCFSEAWLRAVDSLGNPTGAVDMIGSTIDQSWASPMDAQDEMVDILVGTYADNKKILFGSLVANGWGHMIDEYGNDGNDMADTWTCFGDASLMVRTKTPQQMTVTYPDIIPQGSYHFEVNCDVEGALVSITHHDSICGVAYDSNGVADVHFSQVLNDTDSVLITVTAFNKVTYQKYLNIVKVTELPIAKFEGVPLAITAGEKVVFSDSSENYPLEWHWMFAGAVDTLSSLRNPIVEYDSVGIFPVQLIVKNDNGADTLLKTDYITVNPITDPPEADFKASDTLVYIGDTVSFTDLSSRLPDKWHWVFDGGQPDTSNMQNPKVKYDSVGYFSVSLIAGNSIGLDTVIRTNYIHVVPPKYCNSGATYEDEYISGVHFDTINNSSNWSGGYSDYTNYVGTCTQGQKFSVTVNIANSYSADRLYVWCDWNLDGDFDDAEESVFRSTSSSSTYSFEIDVPDSALLVKTRMRIRLNYDYGSSSNTTPCGISNYGEVEDYSLLIQRDTTTANDTTKISDLTTLQKLIKIYPNPTEGHFFIECVGLKKIEIVDVVGRILYEKDIYSKKQRILFSGKSGVYFVRMITDSGIFTKKIIVK